jgi:phosphonate transport system permease protein
MASETKMAPAPLSRESLRERLTSPWPRISLAAVVVMIVLAATLAWSLDGTNASPDELIAGTPNLINFIARLFPPRFDVQPITLTLPALGETTLSLPRAVPYLVETLQMAIIGTLLGVVLSIPFALPAARNLSPHPAVYQVARLLLNVNRAVPDIIFALIFVAAVGLGPFGGVLALAVGAIGSTAKLYAESIEQIDPQQVMAVRATGAGNLQTFIFGVVPQSLPLITSYSLLLFEHNVRSATILGLVGAGGVGFILTKYISLFQYRDLMGALILVIVMVTIIDRISDFLRKKLI